MTPPVRPGASGVLSDAALGVLAWAVPLAVALVTTPLIVAGLGPEGFAIYAWAAAAAAGVAACAPTRGVLHLVARDADAPWRRRVAASALGLAVAIGLFGAAAVWLIAGPAVRVVRLPEGLAVTAVRVAALGAVPGAVLAVSVGALQGLRRYFQAAVLTSVSAVVTAVVGAWMATHGLGVVALVTGQTVVSLGVALAAIVVLRRALGPIGLRPDAAALRGMTSFGLATIAAQLIFAGWVIVERTLVGRYLGASALTAYAVALVMWTHSSAAIASAVQVVSSLVSMPDQIEGRSRLARAYEGATTVAAIAAVGFAALVAGSGASALTFWIGPALAAQVSSAMIPLALGLGLNGLAATAWFANEAMGRPARNVLWAGVGLVLNAASLWLLAPGGDLSAAGVARLVAVVTAPLFIAATERSSAGRLTAPWRAVSAFVVPGGLLLFAVLQGLAPLVTRSWLTFVPVVTGAAVAYLVAMWHLPVLTPHDRAALRRWLVRVIRAGRP